MKTSFSKDHCQTYTSFAIKKISRFFFVTMNRNATVEEISENGEAALRFRRAMVGVLREQWIQPAIVASPCC
jgi:di/tricarboxylate transporter